MTTEPESTPSLSRQALWQRKQKAAGNCIACGGARGDCTSKSRCQPCLDRSRVASRLRTGIALDKPVRKWPKEWRSLSAAEYCRRVRLANKGKDPETPRSKTVWPQEWWGRLNKTDYARLVSLFSKSRKGRPSLANLLAHPVEWREVILDAYVALAKRNPRSATKFIKAVLAA